MENFPPKISIIVAVYNGTKTLQQCIDSVAQQTYPNKELIIIDGGSNDGTVDLINANHEKISYWISEPDRGIYNAWNKGLQQVRGEWVSFLGADDFFWDINVLEHISLKLEGLPIDVRVAYGQVMLLGNGAEPLYLVGEHWDKVKERFKKIMCIPHQGVMHRKSLFELNGKFDESFSIAGDYEFLMRELKFGNAFFMPNITVAGMRQGGVSSNPASMLATLAEVRRAQKKNGDRLPRWIWMVAMLNAYTRIIFWTFLGDRLSRKILDYIRYKRGLPPYWTKT